MNQFCSQDTLPDFGTNLRILFWKPTNQATRKTNLWYLMTLQPELSLRWNCNPRLFESYFIPVFKENNFHSKIELGMFTLDRWSVPVSDTVNPRAKLRSCWSQGTHPIKTWETKAPVLIYRLAVGGGRLGDFGPVTLLDAFPPHKALDDLIPRPFTVYSMGSFFSVSKEFHCSTVHED